MKKIFRNLIVLLVGICLIEGVSGATLNQEIAEKTVTDFITCMNDGDECALNYIDKSNEEMVANVREYLHAVEIHYYIKDIEKVNNEYYTVKMTINAEGPGWSMSGFTVKYDVKNVNGNIIITDTTLFDHIGTEAVGKFALTIFKIIGFVLLAIFGLVAAIIIIVVFIFKKKK